ncbi:hypothetical protein [Streptomyces mirabilis]|uniref:Uncharacterized protein n=1 Tax=Streptomyces mirabilis TaxID=68239 RepID=A0A1I2RHQ3_9ACTN|nr:hypothetical protein [Streptomyces mirabilis]SFG40032.1 hypothetical protein SAMN02787118_12012 [Streptomyces mirabilis]
MTGAGEDWMGDALDIAGADCGLWVPGVDYMSGWRGAREAADRLNRALLGAGFELSQLRAVASTDEGGRGVVRVACWPDAAERLAVLLEAVTSGDDGGAA